MLVGCNWIGAKATEAHIWSLCTFGHTLLCTAPTQQGVDRKGVKFCCFFQYLLKGQLDDNLSGGYMKISLSFFFFLSSGENFSSNYNLMSYNLTKYLKIKWESIWLNGDGSWSFPTELPLCVLPFWTLGQNSWISGEITWSLIFQLFDSIILPTSQ